MRELKACPFCGESENLYIEMEEGIYFVKCEECGSRGGESYRPDNASTLWDMRSSDDNGANGVDDW